MSETIETVREEMYDLVGHIEFGDYSDLDTYWQSVADSLKDLSFSHTVDYGKASTTSAVLVAIATAFDLKLTKLIQVTEEMEKLSDRGSDASIDEDDAKKLGKLAGVFESLFEEFLEEKISDYCVDEE